MSAVRLLLVALALALAGCSALPDKPVQQTMFDFGPEAASPGTTSAPARPALVLPEVEVSGVLETTALMYRLGYDNPNELRPYAYARWSAPPGQLLRQRLRNVLGRERPVLDPSAAVALSRRGAAPPPVLRVELEEFTHVFDSPTASQGVVRVRCTLLENTAAGERLVAQRSFSVQRPASSADAAGGVRALAEASSAAAQDIAAWLQQR
jgi:cholesterol transport system auxiliary component